MDITLYQIACTSSLFKFLDAIAIPPDIPADILEDVVSSMFGLRAMVRLRNVRLESVLLCVSAFIAIVYLLATQLLATDLTGHESGHHRLGAVASESKICTQIGIDLLKAGGNAADAVCVLLLGTT